ncbi:MAG: hypothetical protein ACKVOR_07940 [Flavobacteriales bacterium]
MTIKIIIAALAIAITASASGQNEKPFSNESFGIFSLGTRNTFSSFSHDKQAGIGIGGQFRLQYNERINTEWYFDYITYQTARTYKNDYHIGWSVLYYPGRTVDFSKLLQPYLIAGHCFDLSMVGEKSNETNKQKRTSMATQAGLGTHINITPKLDCSLSAQYMLHFGKEMHVHEDAEHVEIEKHNNSAPDGHLLFTVSFNYKLVDF